MWVHMVTLCSQMSVSSFSTMHMFRVSASVLLRSMPQRAPRIGAVNDVRYSMLGRAQEILLKSMLYEGREPHLSQAWSVGRPSSSAWCFAFTSLTSATARAVSGGPSVGPHSSPPLHAPA